MLLLVASMVDSWVTVVSEPVLDVVLLCGQEM